MAPAVTFALPTADRPRAFAFYRDGLGLEAVGDPADDGVPEPLQFVLTPGCHLMLIPTGGFGWVTAGHETAQAGTSECLLSIGAGSPDEVDALVARARDAGATVTIEPGDRGWTYAGTFADPDGHLWMVATE